MRIFPTKELKFRLINNQAETLDRLNRRTERSDNLTSQFTDKSFRGLINGNEFKLISSAIGRGAFCVMSGQINSVDGSVRVEIHKVFRILLTIILLFPLVGIILMTITETEEFSPVMILFALGQVLMIRYIFIGLAFRLLSRESLNRLRDVLDLDLIKSWDITRICDRRACLCGCSDHVPYVDKKKQVGYDRVQANAQRCN